MKGSSKLIAWKDYMEELLDGNGLLEYVKIDIPKLGSTDLHHLAQWKKDVVKARRIILEGVQDHIISNIHGKETPFAMWNALTEIFKNSSDHRK